MPATAERRMARKPPPRKSRPNDPIHVIIGRVVAEHRGDRTDADIAREAGIHASKLSQILGGHIKDPRISTVRRIFRAIGASLATLDQG